MEKGFLMKKTLLITGGSKGLGLVIVKEFLKKDFNIIILDRNELDVTLTIQESQHIKFHKIDLSDVNQMKAFTQSLEQNKTVIDVLALNAAPRVFKDFDSFTHQEINDLSNASFVSSLMLLNTILGRMKIKNSGKIIIISSKSGLKGYSTGALYCAFKSAWITFHESISRELKHVKGLSILTICPDSFSNNDGSKRIGHAKIINKITRKISSFLNDNNSELYFPSRHKTKISYILLFIKKLKLTIK